MSERSNEKKNQLIGLSRIMVNGYSNYLLFSRKAKGDLPKHRMMFMLIKTIFLDNTKKLESEYKDFDKDLPSMIDFNKKNDNEAAVQTILTIYFPSNIQ